MSVGWAGGWMKRRMDECGEYGCREGGLERSVWGRQAEDGGISEVMDGWMIEGMGS